MSKEKSLVSATDLPIAESEDGKEVLDNRRKGFFSRRVIIILSGLALILIIIISVATPLLVQRSKNDSSSNDAILLADNSAINSAASAQTVSSTSSPSATLLSSSSTSIVAHTSPSSSTTSSSSPAKVVQTSVTSATSSTASATKVTTSSAIESSSTSVAAPPAAQSSTSSAAPKSTLIASGIPLRIIPLGASITYGSESSDGNGYRLRLLNDLTGTAGPVQYVGSVQSGNMSSTNNYNEGHPGINIQGTIAAAKLSDHNHPNIILIHTGTNDLDNDALAAGFSTAPDRMGLLIDELVTAAPSAAILVAALIHAGNPVYDSRIQTFNAGLPAIVAARVSKGHRVLLVTEMGTVNALSPDGIHPTDAGYVQMADIWFKAIKEADAKGWITTAV